MRISDWSSDVCSSDLRGRKSRLPARCRPAGSSRACLRQDLGRERRQAQDGARRDAKRVADAVLVCDQTPQPRLAVLPVGDQAQRVARAHLQPPGVVSGFKLKFLQLLLQHLYSRTVRDSAARSGRPGGATETETVWGG